MSAVQLETTTGVLVSIEDYNSLEDARKVAKVFGDGVALTVHVKGVPCGICVAKTTMLHNVCEAAMYLLGWPYEGCRYDCLNTDGVLLELPRTLEELRLKSGDRLFISPRFEVRT